VGRYGGDEFVIIVPGITSVRAIHLADQLIHRVTDFHVSDGTPLAYKSSVGIAECPPYDDLMALLIHADRAMYTAKQAGGGAWRIYSDAAGAEQTGTGAAAASEATGTHRLLRHSLPWSARYHPSVPGRFPAPEPGDQTL
jgi:predicted signal transduction protein with EAL and GGDEF domain